jgi:hypothetical protein
MSVLAATAGLADKFAFLLDGVFTDSLTVVNQRLADIGLDSELALHAIDNDFQVQLAHAGDNRLTGLVVYLDAEGRVFFG